MTTTTATAAAAAVHRPTTQSPILRMTTTTSVCLQTLLLSWLEAFCSVPTSSWILWRMRMQNLGKGSKLLISTTQNARSTSGGGSGNCRRQLMRSGPGCHPFLATTGRILHSSMDTGHHVKTCLLIHFCRMHRPERIANDTEKVFGMRKSHMSACMQTFSAGLFLLSHQCLVDPRIWHWRMPHHAERVSAKCGRLMNIWGFIDGTVQRMCKPICSQNLVHTKCKKCHGLKFQSIVVPDGHIACLCGPFVAKRHDARMLRESGLMDILRGLMPADGSNGPVHAVHGDLAHPQSIWLFGGHVNPSIGTPERDSVDSCPA